ncbi:MAG: alkaline phosphatase family protein [Desulfurococcales archaeon]|nr:alkaline phosphatase family protein [Desulfurococcales archaeon]
MRANAIALFLVLLVVASGVPSTLAQEAIGAGAQGRVVLLSIDAARPDFFKKYAREGVMPNLASLLEQGVMAKGMIVAFPSATAVSHAVLSTGAPPGINGITGNRIHLPGTKVTDRVLGFRAEYLEAEPIWVTADREGLKVIVLAFPQSTPSFWEDKLENAQMFNPYDAFLFPITFSALYTTNQSVSRATYIELVEPTNWSNLDQLGIQGPAYESSIKVGDDTWYILVFDSTGDGSLDKVAIVPRDKDASKAAAILSEGEWSRPINTTITYKGSTYVVAPRFKALNLTEENFRLYRSLMRPNAFWFNEKSEDLAWRIWNNVVTRTGMITDGDWFGLVNGWFGVDTYMETVRFTNEFFREAARYVLENEEFDLLITYTPVIDNVFHQFLGMADPEMPYYRPEFEDYLREAHGYVDSFIGAIMDNIDLKRDAFIIVSDHGQWSVKKFVHINSLLASEGLLVLDENGRIDLSKTKAYYIGYNQIFVNLQGREANGTVPLEEYREVVSEIMEALSSLEDPETGEPVVSFVGTREEGSVLGLFGPRAGDVIFSLRPNYAASGSIRAENGEFIIFSDPVPLKTVTGVHGDLPYYEELLGVFIAAGAGIPRGELGFVSALSVAPTLSLLLDIPHPSNSIGAPLGILAPETITETLTETTTETVTETTTTEITVTETFTETQIITDVRVVTETETLTRTETTTLTTTIERTVREETTVTETTTMVTTTTATTTTTETVERLSGTAAAGVLVLGLVIGFLASRMLRR